MNKVSIIVAVSLAAFAAVAAAKGVHQPGHGLGLGHGHNNHLGGHEFGLEGPFQHEGKHLNGLFDQIETEELEQELLRRGRFHHQRPFRPGFGGGKQFLGRRHHGLGGSGLHGAGLGSGVGLGSVAGLKGKHSNFGGLGAADRKNIHGKGELHNNNAAAFGNQFDTDLSDSVHDELEAINRQDVVDQDKLIVKESNKGFSNTQGFKNSKGANKHAGLHSGQQAAFDSDVGASSKGGASSDAEFGTEAGSNSELGAGLAHGLGAASL